MSRSNLPRSVSSTWPPPPLLSRQPRLNRLKEALALFPSSLKKLKEEEEEEEEEEEGAKTVLADTTTLTWVPPSSFVACQELLSCATGVTASPAQSAPVYRKLSAPVPSARR